MRIRNSVIAVVLLMAAAGCESLSVCTDELTLRVNPTHITISVGESFTPSVAAETCGRSRSVRTDIRWSTANAAVAAIDAQSGRTTGRRPGLTAIEGDDQSRFGVAPLIVTVRVTD